jgi:hypothetical protein
VKNEYTVEDCMTRNGKLFKIETQRKSIQCCKEAYRANIGPSQVRERCIREGAIDAMRQLCE